ncbi:uncharacterized protein LOC106013466 [Aplysia californica]|uniref:Uncharacterized protein LOC106013466 n=1 Tax=Aplysia californica TaxID=6500 RepID=A0ABM1ABW5_APLCA|nr:uncharacterized protein LOC106013466 [Aplysia californica]
MKFSTTFLCLCGLAAIFCALTFAHDDVRAKVDKRDSLEERDLENFADALRNVRWRSSPYPGYTPWWGKRDLDLDQEALKRELVRRGLWSWVKETYHDVKDKLKQGKDKMKQKAKEVWNKIVEREVAGKRRVRNVYKS